MIVRYTNPSRIRDQLIKCINLLGGEYSELDYTIDVYKTKARLLKERDEAPDLLPEQYNQVLYGEVLPPGLTDEIRRTIKIFYFNLSPDSPQRDLDLVFNLFHEIRHAWQNTNGLYTDEEGQLNIDSSWDEYKNSPSEKDANEFAISKAMEHKEQIKKIFRLPAKLDYNLKLNW